MNFRAEVDVMPLKALLDPQGKAVTASMVSIGLPQIQKVRVGKHISMELEAVGEEEARALAEEACKKLLANPVMEYFEIHIQPM